MARAGITTLGLVIQLAIVHLAIAPGCSPGDDDGTRPRPQPIEPPPPPPRDAAPGITDLPDFDPSSGMHLDDDGTGDPVPQKRPKNRASRPLDIMLKSSPSGAMAAVDGVQLGTTPAYWFGESDGREHEFTFVLRGHAVARYRFVPVQSGVVHARLEPIAEDPLDGGLAPQIAPTFAPDASVAPPPPPPAPPMHGPSDVGPSAVPPDAPVVTPPLRAPPGPTP